MPSYGVREAAALLHVSDDTLRRWAEAGRIQMTEESNGRRIIEGEELAKLAASMGTETSVPATASTSSRNRFLGIVTHVAREGVMAQVSVQCGPYRMVSLLSREAADELELAEGVQVVTSVKATNVVIERPADAHS